MGSVLIDLGKSLSQYIVREKGELASSSLSNQQQSERYGREDRQEAEKREAGRLYAQSRLHKSFTSHA